MFTRDLIYGDFRVRIDLHDDPAHTSGNDYLFGFPLHNNLEGILSGDFHEALNDIKGYFLLLRYDADNLTIATDITAGYRVYLYRRGNTLYVSDDYPALIDTIHGHGPITIDENELRFWRKHHRTTGKATLVSGLHKLPPAGIVNINAVGIDNDCYFRDLKSRPDPKKHRGAVVADLENTINSLTLQGKKIILLFSGGSDSTILAWLLARTGADFTAVTFAAGPPLRANAVDVARARRVAEKYHLPLDIIDVDLRLDDERMRDITKMMLFDRHFAVLHFEGMQRVREKYGPDIIVINGQTADAVLSHGPSGHSRGDLTARILQYRPFSLPARLATWAVSRRFHKKTRMPGHQREYLMAFFDRHEQYAVLPDDDPPAYRAYIGHIVDDACDRFSGRASCLMYLRLLDYVQGSDNQVVIKSARAAGLNRVIMPFAASPVIYATIRYRDDIKDIFKPKYPITETLLDAGWRPLHDKARRPRPDEETDDCITRINDAYEISAREIMENRGQQVRKSK